MSDIIEKKNIEAMIGYEHLDEELKKKFKSNPELKNNIESWIRKQLGQGSTNAIKLCNVEFIDYDAIDYDDLDEFESKDLLSKIKKNNRICPHHRICPMFNSNEITKNEKCVMEVLDTQFLLNGLAKELEVEVEDFNDRILINQLVSMNILYNRTMYALAAEDLIKEVKTFAKGSVNIDTKINDNFAVAEKTLNLMEKLRKSLLLNRDDKLKCKKIKRVNDELKAKERIESVIKKAEQSFDGTTFADTIEISDIEC